MKTINKTKSIFIIFSALFTAVVLIFGLTAFNTQTDINPPKSVMPGVVYEIEVKDHEQSPPKLESMEAAVEGKNLKMEILPGENSGRGKMIFRGDRGKNGEVTFVDDDKQEYYVIDDAFIERILAQVDKSKSMMQDAMKHLTKEQREMIEKMQKENGAKIPGFEKAAIPQMKLVNTGEKANKMGYPCVKYEVYLDGKKIREIWTTDWSNVDGGDEAEDAFGAMNKFFERIKDKFGDMPGGNNFHDEMNFGNGFPIVTRGFDEDTGELEEETTLRSARRRTLDPADFEPPSGYKRRSMGPY